METLTPQQELFVAEYLIDLNATQAAIRAGYKWPKKIGPRLVGQSRIIEAIDRGRARQMERTGITADYVLQGLRKEAEYTGEGSSHSARVAAYTQLGKHLGLFVDRVEHSAAARLVVTEEIVTTSPGELPAHVEPDASAEDDSQDDSTPSGAE